MCISVPAPDSPEVLAGASVEDLESLVTDPDAVRVGEEEEDAPAVALERCVRDPFWP